LIFFVRTIPLPSPTETELQPLQLPRFPNDR
jgi:hypothetical protein